MVIPSVVAPDSDEDSVHGDYATASEGPATPSRSRDADGDGDHQTPAPKTSTRETSGQAPRDSMDSSRHGPEPKGGMSVREATKLSESPDRSTGPVGGLKGLMGKLGI